jgi:large subunit ribosomal protein L18
VAIKYRNKTDPKRINRYKKKMRIRKGIYGTTDRPRLTVFKSLKHLYVQLIDDTVGRTIVASSTVDKNWKAGKNKEGAKLLGSDLAKKAIEKNIKSVVFDRNGYRYHGKIKEVADAAREAGLQF